MSTVTAPPSSKQHAPQDDPTSLLPKRLARSRPLFDPRDRQPRVSRFVCEAEPGYADEEPGDVRRRSWRRADHHFSHSRFIHRRAPASGSPFQIALWLWFTVLFANFAEAMAEARGKAQADTLRKTKTDAPAKRLTGGRHRTGSRFRVARG